MSIETGRPVPFGPLDDAALEAALVDLGAAIALPPTPDLASRVGQRLRAENRRPATRPIAWRLRWALVAALLALLLLAGAAVGFGWRLPGLVITFGGPTPAPTSTGPPAGSAASSGSTVPAGSPAPRTASLSPPRAELDMGRPVTLDVARAGASFPVFVPASDAVGGEQPVVYLDETVPGGEVALAYPASDAFPAPSTAPADDQGRPIGVLITESRGTVNEAIVQKIAPPGTTVTEVPVNGQQGLWIAGEPHSLVILDGTRQREETLRQVGNVLVWTQAGTLIRIELAGDLGDAQAIAASMR